MKYSIKQLLLVTIPIGIYFACVASAFRGSSVGKGLAFAVPAIAIWFLAMAAVYWFALAASKIGGRFTGRGSAASKPDIGKSSKSPGASSVEVSP